MKVNDEIYIPVIAEETERKESINEVFPIGNIRFIEIDEFNGVKYYDIERAGIITSAKVRADIRPGDIFNVYTVEERKYGVTYDGVSLESSLNNDLSIIEFHNKGVT